MQAPSPQPQAHTPSRGRRLWRRVRIPALVLVVCVAGLMLLTNSPLTGALVLPQLSKRLNADVTAESVRVGLDGVVRLRGVRASAPGVDGPAAAFAEARAIDVALAWPAALVGAGSVRSVELTEPLIRVSQSMETGGLNIAGLALPKGAGRVSPADIPRVTVVGGTLELGEHTSTAYRWLKRIAIDGDITPVPDPQGGGYRVSLIERERSRPEGRASGDAGISIEGRIAQAGLALTLRGVDMKDWPASTVPTPIRPQWERLALEGRLSEVVFSYAFAGSPIVQASLDGVALNLPLPEEGAPGTGEAVTLPAGKFLRVRDTSGQLVFTTDQIRGSLEGRIEEVPYHIDVTWQGADVNAPFEIVLTSLQYNLAKDSAVLRYVPQTVRRRLDQFSNPTGLVDARVVISRGPPADGLPAEVKVKGQMDFTNAVSSFQDFPYEFRELSGRAIFDDDSILFENITGRAESGATVSARVYVAPLTHDAGVEVEVEVKGMSLLDPAFRRGLGPERARLIDAVLDPRRAAELINAGRLREPGAPGFAPPFAVGGVADISIYVRRMFGERSDWYESIIADIRGVGLLPADFPLPLSADSARVQITDDLIEITGGPFRAPRGGHVELSARASLADLKDEEIEPTASIVFGSLPADDLLRDALAHALRADEDDPEGVDPGEVVRRLELGGAVTGRVDINAVPTGGLNAVGLVGLENASVTPASPGVEPGVRLEGLSGVVGFSGKGLSADVSGKLSRLLPSGDDPAPADAAVRASLPKPGTPAASRPGPLLAVELRDLDLSLPVEQFIAALAPDVQSRVDELRRERRPEGRLDASIQIRRPDSPDLPLSAAAEITSVRRLAFDALGARIDAGPLEGSVTLLAGRGEPAASFDRLAGPFRVDGEDAGHFTISGAAALTEEGPAPPGGPLLVDIDRARFESGLAPRLVRAKSQRAAELFDLFKPAGEFSARAEWAGPGSDIAVALAPASLSVERQGQRISFPSAEGRIELTADRGRIDALTLHAPSWSLAVNGDWHILQSGPDPEARATAASVSLDLTPTAAWGDGLPPDLRAAMPEEVRQVIDDLGLSVRGGMSTSGLRVSVSESAQGPGVRAVGRIDWTGASLDPGVSITEADGSLELDFERRPEAAAPRFDAWATLSNFRAAGVRMTQGRARLRGDESGLVFIPTIQADCHDGRVVGQAVLRPSEPAGTGRPYEAELRLAGVQFGPLLDDLRAAPSDTPGRPEDRGRLDASFSLSGAVGDPAGRTGRGMGQIGGGRVVTLPVLTPLIRVSNLQLPVDERVDLARAAFFLRGRRLSFEELLVSSRSVQIVGFGTVDWPGGELDLRLNSRSGRRVPLVSDLVEAVRDELISTEVSGTLSDPRVSLVSLPGTRWLVGRLLGVQPSPQDRQIERLRREADQAARRKLRQQER